LSNSLASAGEAEAPRAREEGDGQESLPEKGEKVGKWEERVPRSQKAERLSSPFVSLVPPGLNERMRRRK